MDQQTKPLIELYVWRMDGPTKWGVESRSTRLKMVKNAIFTAFYDLLQQYKWTRTQLFVMNFKLNVSWVGISIFCPYLSCCLTKWEGKPSKNGQKRDFDGILRHKLILNVDELTCMSASMYLSAISLLFDHFKTLVAVSYLIICLFLLFLQLFTAFTA